MIQELVVHKDGKTTTINTQVLNNGGRSHPHCEVTMKNYVAFTFHAVRTQPGVRR